MRFDDEYVIFEHLVRSDPEVFGRHLPVKAVLPFNADNASGEFQTTDLERCEQSGKAAGNRLGSIFG